MVFDILVTLYERYDRNCVCLHHKFHRIDERTRAGWSFRRVSFLLSNDGIKLLISNIVAMYIPFGPFLLRSRG